MQQQQKSAYDDKHRNMHSSTCTAIFRKEFEAVPPFFRFQYQVHFEKGLALGTACFEVRMQRLVLSTVCKENVIFFIVFLKPVKAVSDTVL